MRYFAARYVSAAVLASFLELCSLGFSDKTNASDPAKAFPVNARRLSPQDAGGRYGQALGALRNCYRLTVSSKVEDLLLMYTGEQKTQFEAEANRVIQT